MSDTIRCPACRGAKKVHKLGGMVGECNTCVGKGSILFADKPKPVINEPVVNEGVVISSVADCVPASDINPFKEKTIAVLDSIKPKEESTDIKVDGKRALYKRKR